MNGYSGYLHFKYARGNKTPTVYVEYETIENKVLTSPFDLTAN